MIKTRPINIVKQLICYVCGLFIITIGINISKMSCLGISPVSSTPRACEVAFGLTMGTTTFIVYIILILLQLIILRKNFKIRNALGIIITFIFSWMVDFTGTDPNAFGHLLSGFPTPQTYFVKLIYLVCSLFIIGTGVFLYLRPQWIPMPAEGLAAAISEKTHKPFGDCKTIVDTSLITIALIIQLIFLGGFKSFLGSVVVVREGTVFSALLVGQVVKLLTKLFGKKLEGWLNKQ